MEPDVGFAYLNDDGKLCIHTKSIGLGLHAAMIAPGLGVKFKEVIMVQNPSGGTFGYKLSPTMEALLGAGLPGHRKAGFSPLLPTTSR